MDNISILIFVIGLIISIISLIRVIRVINGFVLKRFKPFHYVKTIFHYNKPNYTFLLDKNIKSFYPFSQIAESLKEKAYNAQIKCSKAYFMYILFIDFLISIIGLALGIYLIIKTF